MAKSRGKNKARRDYGYYYTTPDVIYDSLAYISLSSNAIKLWHRMMTQAPNINNGKLCVIYKQMKKYGFANGSLFNALNELIEKGFVVRTVIGTKTQGGGIPSRYRMTHLAADVPKHNCPEDEPEYVHIGPTNEYQKWEPLK